MSPWGSGTLIGATRGPVMLITLGVLLALDQMGPVSFSRTWPALLIVFGVFKLAETTSGRNSGGSVPPGPGGVQSGSAPQGGIRP